MGQKRTNDGTVKPQKAIPAKTSSRPSNSHSKTVPLPIHTTASTTSANSTSTTTSNLNKQNPDNISASAPTTITTTTITPPQRPQKLPKLPSYTTIHRRPLTHPAIPSPYTSSTNNPTSNTQKTLYITAHTAYIPSIKRIRKLLALVQARDEQSQTSLAQNQRRQGDWARGKGMQANGRLTPADVEGGIVAGAAQGGRGASGGEEVHLKATGRAIERALQIGLHFQGQDDCRVRVEMGSVTAIDDVEIKRRRPGENGNADDESKRKDEDIPETRVRNLSSITVAIGLK